MQNFLLHLVKIFVITLSYRSVVREFFNLSDTVMVYFTKVSLLRKKSSDLINSIFDSPIVLAGIESGKVRIQGTWQGLSPGALQWLCR